MKKFIQLINNCGEVYLFEPVWTVSKLLFIVFPDSFQMFFQPFAYSKGGHISTAYLCFDVKYLNIFSVMEFTSRFVF